MNESFASLQRELADRYRIGAEVGRGGMAVVWRAEDLKHGREVAIKVLGPEASSRVEAQRFHREIRIAAGLQHPHILPVYDSGEAAGHLYYVMPYVRGASLRDRLDEQGPLPVEEAVRFVREVAGGLSEAHSRGLVHRDLKPENIVVSGGHAVLLDFGIARAVEEQESGRLTRTGLVLGTSAYMSPEQWSGEELDGHADQYSLACVLFELLTGRPPFTAEGSRALFAAHLADAPPSVRELRPEVPAAVDAALRRAMAKEPAGRFGDIRDFAAALQDPGAEGPVRWPHGVPVVARRTGYAVATLLVLALLYAQFAGSGSDAGSGPRLAKLVVLPFRNIGDAENRYFTDGIAEEITNRLGAVADLGVIGRTSALQYRDTEKTVAQIGEELGVDYIVGGTVRWGPADDSLRRLRLSARLERASDGTMMWQEDYDVVLHDVFALQTEIAQRVVDELGLRLLPAERELLTSRPTDDPEAYDLYLKGNDAYLRSWARADVEAAIDYYRRATEKDPRFALAFASLGWTHAWMHQLRYDPTPERLRMSLAAIDSAAALHPDLPQVEVAYGLYYYWGFDDYETAAEHLERARRRIPSNARLTLVLGNVLRRKGDFEQALVQYRRATELDPRSPVAWFNLGETYLFTRQFDSAGPGLERAVSLAPDFTDAYMQQVRLVIGRDGDVEAARRILEDALQEVGPRRWRTSPFPLFRIVYPPEEVLRRLREDEYALDSAHYHSATADVLGNLGREEEARAHWDSARMLLEPRLAEGEGAHWLHSRLGVVYAALGRAEDALHHADLATDLLPVSRDALDGPAYVGNLALVHAMLENPERALAELERVLTMPSWLTRNLVRLDPTWRPLHGEPGFRSLVGAEARRVASVPAATAPTAWVAGTAPSRPESP